MKNPPAAVIPMPLNRLPTLGPRAGEWGPAPRPERPIRGLVVEKAAKDREFVCRAGQCAAGEESEWVGAVDAVTAARLLASSEIDIVVADSHSIPCDLQGLTAGSGDTAPLIVVISEGDEPERIEQMLDAGADCCLPKRLPRRMLEGELRRLVAGVRSKHSDPFGSPTGRTGGGT